jgi:hypothetical protein
MRHPSYSAWMCWSVSTQILLVSAAAKRLYTLFKKMCVFSVFRHSSDTRHPLFSATPYVSSFMQVRLCSTNASLHFPFVPLTASSRLFPSSVAAVRFFQERVLEEEKVRHRTQRFPSRLRVIGGRIIWSMCHTFSKDATQTIWRGVHNVSAHHRARLLSTGRLRLHYSIDACGSLDRSYCARTPIYLPFVTPYFPFVSRSSVKSRESD